MGIRYDRGSDIIPCHTPHSLVALCFRRIRMECRRWWQRDTQNGVIGLSIMTLYPAAHCGPPKAQGFRVRVLLSTVLSYTGRLPSQHGGSRTVKCRSGGPGNERRRVCCGWRHDMVLATGMVWLSWRNFGMKGFRRRYHQVPLGGTRRVARTCCCRGLSRREFCTRIGRLFCRHARSARPLCQLGDVWHGFALPIGRGRPRWNATTLAALAI